MSITAFSNNAVLAADPLVEHGVSEITAVDLVTCQSATAKAVTEKLLSLIDEYGSSEVNPETHEILDELKVIDPMKVDLDASGYGIIPETPE